MKIFPKEHIDFIVRWQSDAAACFDISFSDAAI